MKRNWTGILIAIVIICAVVFVSLAFARRYIVKEVALLQAEKKYATPEEGARLVVKDLYTDIEMVEIISAQRKYGFEDLELVVIHVWARALADGSSFGLEDYDSAALFFLELDDGWVNIPQGKAQLIAIGKRVFKLPG